MNNKTFKPIKCGETIPIKNPHAISVSMPSLQNVIDYEEHTPEISKIITSAYPRFVRHPYIRRLSEFIAQKYSIANDNEVVIFSSQEAANRAIAEIKIEVKGEFNEPFGVAVAGVESKELSCLLKIIQEKGCILSSRAAQDYLYNNGILSECFEEDLYLQNDAENQVKLALAKAYAQSEKLIAIAPSGMNAVYAVAEGIRVEQAKNGRHILVQLGWLYSDSMSVVKSYSNESKVFLDVAMLNELEAFLAEHGNEVSALLTEVPTNPLLKCVDLPRLRKLCTSYNIPLIIDTTIATPFLCNFTPYADIIIESLSKFASGNADVLMGAIIFNEYGSAVHLKDSILQYVEPVFVGDAQRMVLKIQNYEERVVKTSKNAELLVRHFESCDYIEKVYSHQFNGKYVALVSVTFKKNFRKLYDELNLPKGPSLGTEFTLAMPYTYLAHYDLINNEKGRAQLQEIDMPIDLLRISVGTEPIEMIIAEFDRSAAQI